MPAPIGRVIRTSAYSAVSRLQPASIAGFARHPAGRLLLTAGQRALAGGSLTITAGAAGRLLLDGRYLPIGHPLGYGIVRGVVEPSVQEALRRNVAPGMTVYDIGADIGFFTILSARLTGPSGRVEAFEPVSESVRAVRANGSLNGFGNVRVHEVAVSDHEGHEPFLVQTERSWSHLSDRGEHPDTREQAQVELICLDEQIRRGTLPAPDVVKIDVEGSEGAVLRGLGQTLRSRRVTVVCELHETNAEVVELLSGFGYSVENLDGTAPVLAAGPVHILARKA
jgi:FkbM family methyltransferase